MTLAQREESGSCCGDHRRLLVMAWWVLSTQVAQRFGNARRTDVRTTSARNRLDVDASVQCLHVDDAFLERKCTLPCTGTG